MGDPRLFAADENLNRMGDYLPILSAFRTDGNDIEHEYVISDDKKTITIYQGEEVLDSIPSTDFSDNAVFLFNRLKTYEQIVYDDGKKHYPPIPELNDFMKKTRSDKLKEKSSEKKDIQFKVDDAKNACKPVVGFSIKSYIGQKPTLFNVGKNTNFRFKVDNCNDKKMQSINSKNGLKDKMAHLFESGCDLKYESMLSKSFRMNLELIDSHMDSLLAEVIRYMWKRNIEKISDIIGMIASDNPLKKDNKHFYEYKMKQFLSSVALGMLPETEWDGRDQANGGYIIVKKSGDVVCYFLYNRNEFNDYLFNCTKMEKPSETRHEYGNIMKIGKEYFIDLDPQIRFTLPKKISNKRVRGKQMLLEC